jgi:hypothetical protein
MRNSKANYKAKAVLQTTVQCVASNGPAEGQHGECFLIICLDHYLLVARLKSRVAVNVGGLAKQAYTAQS